MRRFERDEEAKDAAPASDRLEGLTRALWDALVPPSGACRSVQGELVRVNDRLCSEALRNGMGNYYYGTLEDNHYGQMVVFLLDTLIANRGGALDTDDVAFFAGIREILAADFVRTCRLGELESSEQELTEAEQAELDALSAEENQPPWGEGLFNPAQRCIANYCIANPKLVDRDGRATDDNNVRDLTAILARFTG